MNYHNFLLEVNMKGYMIYSTIDEKQTMRIYSSFKKAAEYFLKFLPNLKFKTLFQ